MLHTSARIQTMYVPLRELCRKFDGNLAWNDKTFILPPLVLPLEANRPPADAMALRRLILWPNQTSTRRACVTRMIICIVDALPYCGIQYVSLPHMLPPHVSHMSPHMLPRCHAATLPRCHAATLPRCHAATLPRCHAATLPRCTSVHA
jgi:hypothetical protein